MRELESPKSLMEQEDAVRQMILARLQPTTLIQADQQETISYRLAEIFVAARQLYTVLMPRFLELPTPPSSEEKRAAVVTEEPVDYEGEVFEVFGEVRLNLLNLRDLLEDFEESFLESLAGRLAAEGGVMRVDTEGDDEDAEDEDNI